MVTVMISLTSSIMIVAATSVAILLGTDATVLAVAARQAGIERESERESNKDQTEFPTLPTIEVTLPAGVSIHDIDTADVIDSLIEAETTKTSVVLVPTSQPSWSGGGVFRESVFRQEFWVGFDREYFTGNELTILKTLYQQHTLEFSPLSATEVEKKITTVCTIDQQSTVTYNGNNNRKLHPGDDESTTTAGSTSNEAQQNHVLLRKGRRRRRRRRALYQEDVVAQAALTVDFTMRYQSRHYNVTNYPKLFQNWTTNNLNVVLEQMQLLNIDVVAVNAPKRVAVSTPSYTSSLVPTTAPTRSFYPTTIHPVPVWKDSGETESPDSSSSSSTSSRSGSSTTSTTNATTAVVLPTSRTWSVSAILVFSVALIIALALLVVGGSIYRRRQPANDPTSGTDSSNTNRNTNTNTNTNMTTTTNTTQQHQHPTANRKPRLQPAGKGRGPEILLGVETDDDDDDDHHHRLYPNDYTISTVCSTDMDMSDASPSLFP